MTARFRFRWRHAALVLTAIFIAATWQLLSGNAYEKWDAYDLGAPAYSLLADFIRAGRLLYWNPWLACGSPDFAIAGGGNFSPDLLLAAAITGSGGAGYLHYWMAVWLSGGFGMLLLARHLRAPVWGGLIVALGFVFSGFYTGHAEHCTVLYSYSLLPFIIWRLDAALLQRRILPALQAGALWGMSGLAGYPSLTVFTVALMAAWTFGRCMFFAKGPKLRAYRFAFVTLLLVGLTGVAVLSPSYFSAAYEAKGYSDRGEALSRQFALNSNPFQPEALATLANPSLVSIAIDEFERNQRMLWAKTDLSSLNVYSGIITLLFAMVALTARAERRWRWFLGGLALLALGCAMSQALPLRGWLYDLVPPTRYFRHSSMLRCYFIFLVSVLALAGARDLASWRRNPAVLRRLGILLPAVGALSGVVFAFVVTNAVSEHPMRGLALTHVAVIGGGLIVTALALRRRLTSTAAVLPTAFAILAILDGLATVHFTNGTLSNKGRRPGFPLPHSTSIALGREKFERAEGNERLNANLFFKVATLKNYTPFKNRYHEMIFSDPALHALALGRQRNWFATDAPEVTLNKEVFWHFVRHWAELEAPFILRHSRETVMNPPPTTRDHLDALYHTTAATRVDSTILEYEPEKLVLDTTVPSDGWLMVSERWSRSWHATVNGKPQPISGADFIFRCVPVTRGPNRVEFVYRPVGLPWLVILSWSVLGVIGALTLARMPALIRATRETRSGAHSHNELPAARPALAPAQSSERVVA